MILKFLTWDYIERTDVLLSSSILGLNCFSYLSLLDIFVHWHYNPTLAILRCNFFLLQFIVRIPKVV